MSEQKTHWKKLHNPDYIGSYALEPGQDLVVTIKKVQLESVHNITANKKEDCVVIHFVENVKPMICNSTNSKIIQKLYKTPYIEEWAGKKIQLYSAKVKAFGEVMEALRVREYMPKEAKKIDVKLDCEECKGKIEKLNSLSAESVATHTKKTYGKFLCSECATKLKNKQTDGQNDN